ncbi:MAG: ABC transporter substrate binding protein [Pseudomonadota bacterium]
MTLVLSARAAEVWVVLAEDTGAYAEAGAVLRAELRGAARVKDGVASAVLQEDAGPPALVVTVGVAAFERSLKWLSDRGAAWSGVPVLATLLPRASYEALAGVGAARYRPLSAVVLDQPLARQMALLRRALPERSRVGVLLGPETRRQLGELDRQARVHGLRLVPAPSVDRPEEIYPSLREALANADVLLALPDPAVYNGATLQNILLTSYRARVPLVAFSAAYVRAGALLAVYSTPVQVAGQAAGIARDVLAGRNLTAVQTPREFAVAANTRVAASLGLHLDDAAAIAEDLRRGEERK